MKTRIKEFRARHNLTLATTCRPTRPPPGDDLLYRAGKYNPSLRLAHRIAVALKPSFEGLYIFDEEDHAGATGESCQATLPIERHRQGHYRFLNW